MNKCKDMDMYHYIFHYSHYRENGKQWACVHRKDQRSYWNGTALNENGKKVKISYGSTTEEAFKNMLNNEIH